jgi:S-adenosylmethionine:tRNA ribosyltransferase-isomerase
MTLHTSDFDYYLPTELIAQTPIEPRDAAQLLVLERKSGMMAHKHFTDLPAYLRSGDVLVFNDSRVIPARLMGKKAVTGGAVEVLLLTRKEQHTWEALVKPAHRVRLGMQLEFGTEVTAEVVAEGEEGIRTIRFSDEAKLLMLGEVALPPYIHTPLQDAERYQTVYSDASGSVAAPTAGLHFTPELLQRVKSMGVKCLFVTLHVGLDTFRPVQEEDPHLHHIHREYGIVTHEVAAELTHAKRKGHRVICVGTTSVRLVEAAAQEDEKNELIEVQPFSGWVDLFILPGFDFKVADGMITNFHLPRSTLLMLVSAFVGKELIEKVYREAIARRYRFFSFGDVTLIL